MKSSSQMYRLVSAVAFCVIASSAVAQDAPNNSTQVISVTGEGRAEMAPDMALVTLSVVRNAATAREAMDGTSKAVGDILTALKADGIQERDLQTSDFAINPQYQYPDNNNGQNEAPKLIGYSVSNTLNVRVRDVTKLGELLDKSVTLGVNQGGSIQFTNDNPEKALSDARKEAVEDAISKAKELTEAAGIKLGPVLTISENSFRSPPIPVAFSARAQMADAKAPAPIAAGENAYDVSVSMTFKLEAK
ncbi:SIMPL domain-containing protein [Rhizobium sp. CFBP 8762]|uniref:SIMPL domain-containing protein n=1 Tax=Rhizobium sp. CFBP 8762 TaxID=2775279 RepID=UPI0017836828|nr:SIMPL domain-containing protein [Rhizobium sp. CFBP 8762]MBD8554936.1 SIMPL domain-containing protein [Rhizobium sp. CFBP 8762]